jgi:ADP-dependent phosphofructokinase/glucokinase
MRTMTRVIIKRAKRLHTDWSDERILEHAKKMTDQAGIYADTLTLQDVKDVIASMPEYRPGMLL